MSTQARSKLSPHYFGPYQISNHIGEVAYRFRLSPGALIHDVFHVGLLKAFHGDPPITTPSLTSLSHGHALPKPAKALKGHLYRGTWQVLIAWHGLLDSEATWESVYEFKLNNPVFQLEDEVFLHGGRDVMVGLTYQWRKASAGRIQEGAATQARVPEGDSIPD